MRGVGLFGIKISLWNERYGTQFLGWRGMGLNSWAGPSWHSMNCYCCDYFSKDAAMIVCNTAKFIQPTWYTRCYGDWWYNKRIDFNTDGILLRWFVVFQPDKFIKKDTYYLFNHVDINIKYHKVEDGRSRLVRATLEPKR